MPETNSDRFAEQRAVYQRSHFLRHLGVNLVHVEEGRAELELAVAQHMCNRFDVVHGGIISTLIDTAVGQAIRTLLPADMRITTVEFKVNFLAPGREGPLRAIGRVERMGKKLAVARAEVLDGTGETLALGLGTYAVFR